MLTSRDWGGVRSDCSNILKAKILKPVLLTLTDLPTSIMYTLTEGRRYTAVIMVEIKPPVRFLQH